MEGIEEYVWSPIAPLTRIGVLTTKQRVVISHQFPEEFEATVASRFANMKQGFVCTSLMIPANDALALATLIKEHVPEGALDDTSYNIAGASIDGSGAFVIIGTIRDMTAEERTRPNTPETYIIRKEEGSCRVLMVVSFIKAHLIARMIEDISADITHRLVEHLPDPAR